jgi:hypothetical protein
MWMSMNHNYVIEYFGVLPGQDIAFHCKWYYRLLLFLFKFNDFSKRFVNDMESKIEEVNRNFIKKQFGIDYENTQYDNFACVLLKKCSEAGLSRSLTHEFAESLVKALDSISVRCFDSNKLEELISLADECTSLERKIAGN